MWIKVTERLPETDKYIILYDKQRDFVCEGIYKNGDFITVEDYSDLTPPELLILETVTHWQEITPPKD